MCSECALSCPENLKIWPKIGVRGRLINLLKLLLFFPGIPLLLISWEQMHQAELLVITKSFHLGGTLINIAQLAHIIIITIMTIIIIIIIKVEV